MRTTLNIDADVLFAIRKIAAREGKTLGQAISILARKTLCATSPRRITRNGVPLIAVRPGAKPVTAELIRRLQNDLN